MSPWTIPSLEGLAPHELRRTSTYTTTYYEPYLVGLYYYNKPSGRSVLPTLLLRSVRPVPYVTYGPSVPVRYVTYVRYRYRYTVVGSLRYVRKPVPVPFGYGYGVGSGPLRPGYRTPGPEPVGTYGYGYRYGYLTRTYPTYSYPSRYLPSSVRSGYGRVREGTGVPYG